MRAVLGDAAIAHLALAELEFDHAKVVLDPCADCADPMVRFPLALGECVPAPDKDRGMGGREMRSAKRFALNDGDVTREAYHYEACGLDDVNLLNEFEIEETDCGRGVAVHQEDELHRAIGMGSFPTGNR